MIGKFLLLSGGLGLVANRFMRQPKMASLTGEVALITGGTRGLGFILARDFGKEGCKIAICARDEEELERAKGDLSKQGIEALTIKCDVGDRAQVEKMIEEVTAYYGRIDILVNNAGTIEVAPLQNLELKDFENAQNTIFWGTLYPILAVLPQMQRRKSGRVVNISSFGGKVSVPHLLPYSTAKFAVTGLSEGLRAELAPYGISVTGVYPGTMRTGSHLNALFKGQQEQEFTWFSLGASLPFLSLDAERAAAMIVKATKRGQAELIAPLMINIAAKVYGLIPGLSADILGVVNTLLPKPAQGKTTTERGMEVEGRIQSPILDFLTMLGKNAAKRFNQYPGPVNAPKS